MITAKHIKEKAEDLKWELAFSAYHPLLTQLSEYYNETLPSDLDGNVIKETEVLLNELRRKSRVNRWDDSIQQAIQNTLRPAGKMSSIVKGKLPFLRDIYADKFFDNADELGKALAILSRMN